MPRKSAASLGVVRLSSARIQPPAGFKPEYLAEWREIVDSLPADYFRPGDIPLLAAFCAASARHKQADALLDQHGLVTANDRGTLVANPAATILQLQASTMANLAVKLRLCPSARYSEKMANTKAGERSKGARPWETAES